MHSSEHTVAPKSLKNKKCFVLLHPALGYLGETVTIIRKLYGIEDYILYPGPSTQRGSMPGYAEYLAKYKEEIERGFVIRYNIMNVSRSWSIFRILYGALMNCSVLQARRGRMESMKYAARDSLIQGRLSRLYLLSPLIIKRIMERWKLGQGFRLYTDYIRLFESLDVDCISAPHSTYIEYVALIEAAISLGKPCITVGDEVLKIIRTRKTIYHGRDEFARLLEKYDEIKARQGQARPLKVDDTALLKTLVTNKNSWVTSQAHNKPIRVLIIFTHCLRDCNNVTDPRRMLFENFFEWTMKTVVHLSHQRSEFDKIIYKIHPHSPTYKDHVILKRLGKILKLGVNRKKVSIVDWDESLNDIFEAGCSYDICPVTFSGSVAYELATRGIVSITAGKALSTVSGTILPSSRSHYYKMLCSPADTFDGRRLTESQVYEADKLRELMSWAVFPQELKAKDIKSLNRFYHFGKWEEPVTSEIESRMFSERMQRLRLVRVKDSDCADETILFTEEVH